MPVKVSDKDPLDGVIPDSVAADHLRSIGYKVEAPNTPDYPALYSHLERRLNELEARTGLIHRSWFTRAITAWVYVMGIQLIAGAVILIFVSVIGYLLGN